MADIYLDTIGGDDAKDGKSEANAVKTAAKAIELKTEGDRVVKKVGDGDAEQWMPVTGDWNNG